jgi:hypothetical protein
VLDKPGKDWTGLKGFVDEKMVKVRLVLFRFIHRAVLFDRALRFG